MATKVVVEQTVAEAKLHKGDTVTATMDTPSKEYGIFTGKYVKKGERVTVVTYFRGYHTWSTTGGYLADITTIVDVEHPTVAVSKLFDLDRFYNSTGSDPELFITNDGQLIPAWEFLNKQQTAFFGGASVTEVFFDGFQAEMTLLPSTCQAYLVDAIRNGLTQILGRAKDAGYNNAKLLPTSVVEISHEMMESVTDEQAMLGCDPSLSAYEGEQPLELPNPRDLPIRFAGFHWHFGTDKLVESSFARIVRTIDEVIGLPSVSLMENLDDPRRRLFYGKAGEFRIPPHGLEYRTMGGAILKHPVLVHLTGDFVRWGFQLGLEKVTNIWGLEQEEVRRIINESDVKAARAAMESNRVMLRTLCKISYHSQADVAERLFLQGAYDNLPNLDDPHKAWHIGGTWEQHSMSLNCSIATTKL